MANLIFEGVLYSYFRELNFRDNALIELIHAQNNRLRVSLKSFEAPTLLRFETFFFSFFYEHELYN